MDFQWICGSVCTSRNLISLCFLDEEAVDLLERVVKTDQTVQTYRLIWIFTKHTEFVEITVFQKIQFAQRRIKLQDSQLNEIPQYLVRPCVKSPTVARAARDFRYQDNTGTLSPVSLERANNHDRNSWLFSLTALINITFFFLIVFSHSINKHNLFFFFFFFFFYKASFILFNW